MLAQPERAEFRLNPSREELQKQIETAEMRAGKIVLEIGPGEVLGIGLKRKDVYIGVEPYSGSKKLNERINRAERGARINLVEDNQLLPKFSPDLVLSVAPNPNDIEDGVWYEYEKFIKKAKVVVMVLDTRTIEANSGSGVMGLAETIREQFAEMGRKDFHMKKHKGTNISGLMEHVGMEGHNCSLESSADLGNEVLVIWSVR